VKEGFKNSSYEEKLTYLNDCEDMLMYCVITERDAEVEALTVIMGTVIESICNLLRMMEDIIIKNFRSIGRPRINIPIE
jgi:hypothetical protein